MKQYMLNSGVIIFFCLILLFVLLSPITALSAQFYDKTPKDTYQKITELVNKVKLLRQRSGGQYDWPKVSVFGEKGSRHEYQKALEVLTKINHYRKLHKLGEVALPAYPSRDVTPNEVFDLVQRLIAEVNMLLLVQPATKSITRSTTSISPTTVFSRIENYRQLWQISKAFDPLLGVRGFSPNDVFAQSQHILDLVRFLRLTQNMPSMPKKPAKPKGKHPNHALASAYQLLQKIHRAEESLWIDAVDVPMVEKRVITPTEVYDALQTTIAELERIKFRLGVERLQAVVRPSTKKTPNDVIQNLQWAAAAMPIFPFDRPLQQYNPISLEKTPNDVFALATHILKTIKLYKKARGIRVKARVPPPVHGLQPHHVYQKTLESLKKIVELRRVVGFVGNVMPRSPMRPITPNDVFELASRLDNDLHLIYEKSGINIARFQSMDINGKTPSDVFGIMWKISYELDTLLGSEGQTPDDVFQEVSHIVRQIKFFAHRFNYQPSADLPPFVAGLTPNDVILKAQQVLRSIDRLKKRAGMFQAVVPIPLQKGTVTPNDVFNLVGVIGAEFVEIEIHLGIHEQIPIPAKVLGKTPSDVYQQLSCAEALLTMLMGGKPLEHQ